MTNPKGAFQSVLLRSDDASNKIQVSFEHWRYEFPDEQLIRYGSPYYDKKEGRKILAELVSKGAGQVGNLQSHVFIRNNILCANEAFPEAAVADPLADIEVWDEWRSGKRTFPHPGRYSRLGIGQQEKKTSSTSSVGVIGEIFAGLYAQAGIGPWVLVRVIHHWPDFIFYIGKNRYAFVESKAYTKDTAAQGGVWLGVPKKLLGECLVDAVQQLNSDPFVQVWLGFTYLEILNPLRAKVTFLELDTSPRRRGANVFPVVPGAVIAGLAERALRQAIYKLSESELALLRPNLHRDGKTARRQLEQRLVPRAMLELEGLLIEEEARIAVLASRDAISREIKKILRKAVVPERGEGLRLFAARQEASEGGLARIRTIGAETLFVADLDQDACDAITRSWHSNWSDASLSFKDLCGIRLWRCGGALFGIGEPSMEGERSG